MDEFWRINFVVMQVANVILEPIVLLGIVAGFQFINFEMPRKFAWKTWGALVAIREFPLIWALVTKTSGRLLFVDWWPWSSILYAPIQAMIIVLLGQSVFYLKRGVGFAWKTWAVVLMLVFMVESIGVMNWRNEVAQRDAKKPIAHTSVISVVDER